MTEPDPAVPADAILAGIRELVGARDELAARMQPGRSYGAAEFNAAQDRLAERVPPLLAAVEAVLKLADDWEAEGMRLDPQAYENCARALREAIASALTGTQPAGPPQSEEDRRAAAEALEGLRTRLAGKGDGDG